MTQQEKVERGVRRYRSVTRAELSAKLNIRINAVCGRARELLDLGVIKESKKRRACFITGHEAHTLYV